MDRIYPKISSEKPNGYKFTLPEKVNVYMSANLKQASKLYAKMYKQFTVGVSQFNVIEDNNLPENTIFLGDKALVNKANLNQNLNFKILIEETRAMLIGKDFAGLANAFMTLLQLIKTQGQKKVESAYLPAGIYEDAPQIEFRGVHFCLFPGITLDFLKDFIRLSAMYRYSHFVLEFWGTLKYDALDALGWQDAFTKDQIKPIIEEARLLGLEVVPFFNHLGHATQSRVSRGEHVVLNQRPELEVLFEPDGWTWCLSNPEAMSLLKKVRQELIELCGDGSYFHIGIDEAYSFATCPLCSKNDKEKLFSNFLNDITKELKSAGRKAIIWGDMLLSREQFKAPYIASPGQNSIDPSKALELLDKDTVIADWQYEIKQEHNQTAKLWKSKGRDFLMCPWFKRENIIACANIAKEFGGGLLITTWNETQPFFTYLLLGAELCHSCDEHNHSTLNNTITATFLRKLSPQTDRKKAGFKGINTTINMLLEMQ